MKKHHEEKKHEKHEKHHKHGHKHAHGGPIDLKDCKVNTAEKNPKHKRF